MKIIFLDIDGVLNSKRVYAAKYSAILPPESTPLQRMVAKLDPIAIGLVNNIAARADAKIVISSTWRHGHDVESIRAALKPSGLLTDRIIDLTADMRGEARGHEIQEWLNRHPEVSAYIAIDDDADFLPHQCLVRVNHDNGFSFLNYTFVCAFFGIRP